MHKLDEFDYIIITPAVVRALNSDALAVDFSEARIDTKRKVTENLIIPCCNAQVQ